jgi:hypothetical protein
MLRWYQLDIKSPARIHMQIPILPLNAGSGLLQFDVFGRLLAIALHRIIRVSRLQLLNMSAQWPCIVMVVMGKLGIHYALV